MSITVKRYVVVVKVVVDLHTRIQLTLVDFNGILAIFFVSFDMTCSLSFRLLKALEVVKDELGINPEREACDPDFKLDLELLPFLKQKQLLNYLRILVCYQRKKQDDGYKARLVTSLVEGPNSHQPSVQPQQSQSISCSSKEFI